MKPNRVTLYNIIFPFWLLCMLPFAWLFVLPANFVIDLAVLCLALKCMRTPDVWKTAKQAIVRVWLLGFAADFIGTAGMLFANFLEARGVLDADFLYALDYNPFTDPTALVWAAACVLLSAGCIYGFNRRFALKALDPARRKTAALALAVFTAPYFFLLPTAWFF